VKRAQSKTDWSRVLAYKEGDRIPYEPADGPYDPNDANAAREWFAQADLIRKGTVVRRGKRVLQEGPVRQGTLKQRGTTPPNCEAMR
jgi:hypothetical protein